MIELSDIHPTLTYLKSQLADGDIHLNTDMIETIIWNFHLFWYGYFYKENNRR